MIVREKAILELVRLSEEEQRRAGILDKGHCVPCYHNVLYFGYGRNYAALGQRAAVRYHTVGTWFAVFTVPRDRNDESKKTVRIVVAVDVYLDIPCVYVSAYGVAYSVRPCRGTFDAAYIQGV